MGKNGIVRVLVLVLGVLYAAFLQFYLGMTDTQEFLICTAVFVVVCMGVFASMVRVCRGPSTTYGYQALMLTIIVPWLDCRAGTDVPLSLAQ